MAAGIALIVWVAADEASRLWFGYGWSSDKGNGPEAIQQTIAYAVIGVLLYPRVRRAIDRFARRHVNEIKAHSEELHAELREHVSAEHAKVHAKLDRLMANLPDEPEEPTMPTPRQAGRRGARESHEPRLAVSRFSLVPTAADWTYAEWDGGAGVTEWGMDCNGPDPDNPAAYPNGLGDCGAAAVDHGNMAKAGDAKLLGTLGQPKTAGTTATYFSYGVSQGEQGQPPAPGRPARRRGGQREELARVPLL